MARSRPWMHETTLCVTVTAPRRPSCASARRGRRRRPGRAAARLGQRSGRRRRARRTARAGHRHLPAGVGRRALRGIGGGAPADARRGAGARRRVRRHRVARGLRRSRCARPAAAESCCRRTISTACPPTSPTRRGRCAPTGAEVVKIAVTADRLSDCIPLAELGAATGQDGGVVLIAMGRAGLVDARPAGAVRIAWTYAGSVETSARSAPAALLDDLPVPLARIRRPRSTASSGRRSRTRYPRRCTTRRSRRPSIDAVYLPLPAADADDFMTFARAFGLKGASVTIPFKVSLFEPGRRGRSPRLAASARSTRSRVDGIAVDWRQHRRRRVSAPLHDRRRAAAACGRRCSAPAARRGRSRSALASSGAEVTRPRARLAPRAEAAHAVGARAAAVAAGAGQLGPARQLHAGRHVSARRRRRRCRRPR